MVVHEFNIVGVAVLEPEDDPPVGPNRYGPEPPAVAALIQPPQPPMLETLDHLSFTVKRNVSLVKHRPATSQRPRLPEMRLQPTAMRGLPLISDVSTFCIMVEFEWDDDNIGHLARHDITRDEVEELFDGPIAGQRGGTDAPNRFRVLGRTAAGRYLLIIYERRGRGVIRPFTGRDMRPHERQQYDRQT